MKIACLQFAPELGEVQKNIRKAEEVLAKQDLAGINLLVLPELAFSGYNFSSSAEIEPFLEPTCAGVSTEWAKSTAARLNCIVSIGYPETALQTTTTTTVDAKGTESRYFNAAVIVSPAGKILAHYRKTFLYYTDKPWAAEGDGFGLFPLPLSLFSDSSAETTLTANGICMDINPKDFVAPWSEYEFANHVRVSGAQLVILNMAWLSHPPGTVPEDDDEADKVEEGLDAPDRHTELYWIERFRPLWERPGSEGTILVMANRCGIEGDAHYAGSSRVMQIGYGEVRFWDGLGKREERCLVVDTNTKCPWVLRNLPVVGDNDDDESLSDGSEPDELNG